MPSWLGLILGDKLFGGSGVLPHLRLKSHTWFNSIELTEFSGVWAYIQPQFAELDKFRRFGLSRLLKYCFQTMK